MLVGMCRAKVIVAVATTSTTADRQPRVIGCRKSETCYGQFALTGKTLSKRHRSDCVGCKLSSPVTGALMPKHESLPSLLLFHPDLRQVDHWRVLRYITTKFIAYMCITVAFINRNSFSLCLLGQNDSCFGKNVCYVC